MTARRRRGGITAGATARAASAGASSDRSGAIPGDPIARLKARSGATARAYPTCGRATRRATGWTPDTRAPHANANGSASLEPSPNRPNLRGAPNPPLVTSAVTGGRALASNELSDRVEHHDDSALDVDLIDEATTSPAWRPCRRPCSSQTSLTRRGWLPHTSSGHGVLSSLAWKGEARREASDLDAHAHSVSETNANAR